MLRWVFKKMGMIPIEESLANIPSDQEKEDALLRQNKYGQKVFRKIIDKEKNGQTATNIDFVHSAVAALSRGDVLTVFPEGLWINPQSTARPRERAELKQGYRGIELVASQYKKLTGQELPIIPTAFIEDAKTGKNRFVVGEPLKLSGNDTEQNGTDWCMQHIAKMLPEEQRGYYK